MFPLHFYPTIFNIIDPSLQLSPLQLNYELMNEVFRCSNSNVEEKAVFFKYSFDQITAGHYTKTKVQLLEIFCFLTH